MEVSIAFKMKTSSYLTVVLFVNVQFLLTMQYIQEGVSIYSSVQEMYFKRLQLHEKQHRNNLLLRHIKNAGKRNAICMDGSHAKYYMSRNLESNNWIIHLQGGGSCITLEDCNLRAKSPLGSSIPLENRITGDWLLSDDQSINPTFHAWNKVFIPYCSGDVFVGRMTRRKHPYRLSMTGHYILTAVIEDLISNYKIDRQDSKILFGGTSAGGIGVLANLDHVASLTYPAKVFGYNDGGWFTMYPTFGEYKNLSAFDVPKFFYIISDLFNKKWDGFVDKTCAESTSATAACLYGEIAIQHISTPLFVMSHLWDTYQLTQLMHNHNDGIHLPPKNDDEIEFLMKFANHSYNSMTRTRDIHGNGAFATACYSHTFLSSCIGNSICDIPKTEYEIEGKTAYIALSEWFKSEGRKGSYIENIGNYPACNPSCCSIKCRKCRFKTTSTTDNLNNDESNDIEKQTFNDLENSMKNSKRSRKNDGRKKQLAYMYCSQSDTKHLSNKILVYLILIAFHIGVQFIG